MAFAGFVKFFADCLAASRTGTVEAQRTAVLARVVADLPPAPPAQPPALARGPFATRTEALAAVAEAGKATVDLGLVDSVFGNVSYNLDGALAISQTGAALDDLAGCLDICPLDGSSCAGLTASSELAAHGPSLPVPVPEDQALFEAESRLFDGRTALDTAFTAGHKARSAAQAKSLAESRESATGAVPAPTFARFGERFGRELAEHRDAPLGFVAVSGFDTHELDGELTIVVLEGEGQFLAAEGATLPAKPGDVLVCPIAVPHGLTATTDMVRRLCDVFLAALVLLTGLGLAPVGVWAGAPVLPVTVVASFPHDPEAFTQGLLFHGAKPQCLGGGRRDPV